MSMKPNPAGPSFSPQPIQGYTQKRIPVKGASKKDASGRLVRTNLPGDVTGGVKKGKK